MRIALVSQEYPPDSAKGGIGTQAFLKAQAMAAFGHEVHVVSRSADGRRRDEQEGAVTVSRIGGPRLEAHTEPADWVAYSAEVAAELAEIHARTPLDLVEFPEWGCEGYVHLLNRTPWNRVPTVIQLHGPLVMLARTLGWPEPDGEFFRVGRHLEETCLRLADRVYSSSACSAHWCEREYGLARERVPVLHTGVDTRHFSPRPVPKDERPTIVFVGKLAWNKGVGVLVDAACALARELPSLRLRLLGRGDDNVVAELRRRAAGAPEGLLELTGFVESQDLPGQLSRAHVFAAPSRYEGGPGFVYLEAMACGLPAIACEGSGAAEAVVPGEGGFLVPPEDVGALTSALRGLLVDPDARAVHGRRAREFVLRHADSRVCLPRLEAFYSEVAACGRLTAGRP